MIGNKKTLETLCSISYPINQKASLTSITHEIFPSLAPQNKPEPLPIYNC